jgi:hypothetical protein
MAVQLNRDREPHRELVRQDYPPHLFGAARHVGRIGSLALPSETITVASIGAAALLFGIVSFSEATRFFFRLTFSPLWFTIPAFLLSWLIAWRGSKRPGPILPRIWALSLMLLNLAACLAGLWLEGFPHSAPAILRDPYPLHAVAFAGAIATAVLLPRLYPMHPLKRLVQTIAPLSLGVVLAVTVIPVILFMNWEMNAERQTIQTMSARLNAAAVRLKDAASFPYSAGSLRQFRQNRDRIESTLAILRESPDGVSLPDATRWRAAGILERDGKIPPGALEKSAIDLIDAVHSVVTEGRIPELRTGRYIPYGQNLDRYQANDEAARRPHGEVPLFEPPAGIGAVYYRGASAWFTHIAPLGRFQTGDHYHARMADIEGHLSELADRAPTRWWAEMMKPRTGRAPEFNLAPAFETRLSEKLNPLADVRSWSGLRWGSFLAAQRSAPCRVLQQYLLNEQPIPAPPESLTDEQRQSGHVFYLGVKYDAKAAAQCFAYDPPADGSNAPLVVELRLFYEAKGQQSLTSRPCDAENLRIKGAGRCWSLSMPSDAMPDHFALFVDVPPDRAGQANYPQTVSQAFTNSVDRLNAGPVQAAAPQVIPQGGEQQVVSIEFQQVRK